MPHFSSRLQLPGISLALLLAAGLTLHAAPAKDPQQPDTDKIVESALKDFELKKYDEALSLSQQAEKLQPKSPFVLNLVGAAWIKKKNYEAANQYFNKALAIQPDFFPAKFNVGESMFLQGKYADALTYFQGLLSTDPDNELLKFKCFLCQLLLGEKDDAGKALDHIPYPGDTPAWYYAQAAWEMKYGSKGEASRYLKLAHVVYLSKTAIYDETFRDINFDH